MDWDYKEKLSQVTMANLLDKNFKLEQVVQSSPGYEKNHYVR